MFFQSGLVMNKEHLNCFSRFKFDEYSYNVFCRLHYFADSFQVWRNKAVLLSSSVGILWSNEWSNVYPHKT